MDENPFKPPPDLNSLDSYRFIPWVLDSKAFFYLTLLIPSAAIVIAIVVPLVLHALAMELNSSTPFLILMSIGTVATASSFLMGLYLWIRE